MLLGKRLLPGEEIALGGGLTACLLTIGMALTGGGRCAVELTLRTRGAGDIALTICTGWRDSGHAAAEHAEAVLTHLASALRVAGAT